MPNSYMSEQQRQIIDDLRTDICLADQNRKIILHESDIAERYGISRTPVRQVLQYLGHCLTVETQRGYGTVVKPLIPDQRDVEFKAYSAIAAACAQILQGSSIPKEAVVELVGLQTWLSLLESRSEQEFVELNKRLIKVMTSLVPDGLLRHAYSSSHWRVVRWRVLDIREDNAVNWKKLEVGLEEVVRTAMNRDAAALMQFASQMGHRHMKTDQDFFANDATHSKVHMIDRSK